MHTARRFRDIAKFLRLLIWAELLSLTVINVCSFILPIAGGVLKLPWEDISNIRAGLGFLVPVAGLFSARAVFGLAGLAEVQTGKRCLARAIRVLAGTEVVVRWVVALRVLGAPIGQTMGFDLLRLGVYAGVVVCLFVMLARIVRPLHEERLGEIAVIVGLWVALGRPLVNIGAVFVTFYFFPRMEMPAQWATLLMAGITAIIGFRILFALHSRIRRAATSCCIGCGYSLTGLPEERCPECGRDFDRSEIEIAEDAGVGAPFFPGGKGRDRHGMG